MKLTSQIRKLTLEIFKNLSMVITLVSLGLELKSLGSPKPKQLSRAAPLPSKCQQGEGLLSNNFSEKSD